MSNLKALKTRINGVKSTQKITKAMKMVAASKLRVARHKKDEAEPYVIKMGEVLKHLAAGNSNKQVSYLLDGTGKQEKYLIVILSSDKGLCGSFNTGIVKNAIAKMRELEAQGKEVWFYCVGKKAYDAIKYSYKDKIYEYEFTSGKKQVNYSDAEAISKKIISGFDAGKFDVCLFVFSKFNSAVSQTIVSRQVVPLEVEHIDAQTIDASYEFEPEEEIILKNLLPKYLAVQVYYYLLENSASEHGARMTAMENATNNSGEMIKRLTLVYNRTRQAAITTELIEIISGAEALNG